MREEYVGWLDDEWNVVLDHDQPIVRCRDCKYYTHEKSDWCHFHGDIAWSTNGYCAWGERKEVTR